MSAEGEPLWMRHAIWWHVDPLGLTSADTTSADTTNADTTSATPGGRTDDLRVERRGPAAARRAQPSP
ncbi:hypothetical protein [Frankia sp. AgKG'84/4]|uniref:hypothetical protein n=1 Tax=Frankia sp. AgKG'84/4 TaxID=573490 RepID=UPI002010BA76|nr:hypothetical protein [Frankia sp. AgKG'84/4]MCL9796993.1 hypothetical protein [Frankia sp. AgKG'84/4]